MANKKLSTTNDWWNTAVGSSMLMSSIGSIATVGMGIVNSIYNLSIGGVQPSSFSGSNTYNGYSGFMRADQMYTRVSKYPSRATVSYAAI